MPCLRETSVSPMRTNDGNKLERNSEGSEKGRREKAGKGVYHCVRWVGKTSPGIMFLSDVGVKLLHMEQLFPEMGGIPEAKVSIT